MRVTLAGRVELVTELLGGHATTRVYLDGRPLEIPLATMRALAAIMVGVPMDEPDIAKLVEAGLLAPDTRAPRPTAGRLALTARATIEPAFAARGGVTPMSSFPISAFVPPVVLGPLERLATVLRSSWQRIASAALSRDRRPDPDEAAALLAAVAEEAVRDYRALAAVVEWKQGVLVPRVPLQAASLCYPIEWIGCYTDRLPAHLGAKPFRIPVLPGELAPYADLLAQLAAGIDAQHLATLPGPPARVVDALWDAGMLDRSPPPASLAVQPGEVAHLGHATLLANLGGAHVLVDPWFPPASAADRTPPPALAALPALAAIVITHHHWDHVHPSTLLLLPKHVPIYVPAQPDRPLVPRTAALLRDFGFTQVKTLAHGEVVSLGDGGEVIAAPFHGEDPTGLAYGANTYVLRHAGRAALVHVDSGTDASGRSLVSTGEAAALVAKYGALDPVFATRRQERGVMIEHTWEAVLQPPARWTRATENCDNSAAFLASLAQACRATTLVLYSEGGADWYPDGTDFLRGATPTARGATFEHLWDPLSSIEAALAAAGARTVLSPPLSTYVLTPR